MSPQYLLKWKPNVFIWTKIKLWYVTTTTEIILIQKLAFSNLGCGFYKIGFFALNHVHIQALLPSIFPPPTSALSLQDKYSSALFWKDPKGFPAHWHVAEESNSAAWPNELWAGPQSWHFGDWSLGYTSGMTIKQPQHILLSHKTRLQSEWPGTGRGIRRCTYRLISWVSREESSILGNWRVPWRKQQCLP